MRMLNGSITQTSHIFNFLNYPHFTKTAFPKEWSLSTEMSGTGPRRSLPWRLYIQQPTHRPAFLPEVGGNTAKPATDIDFCHKITCGKSRCQVPGPPTQVPGSIQACPQSRLTQVSALTHCHCSSPQHVHTSPSPRSISNQHQSRWHRNQHWRLSFLTHSHHHRLSQDGARKMCALRCCGSHLIFVFHISSDNILMLAMP